MLTREKKEEADEEENKSVQQKKNTEGKNRQKKIHYVSDRNHWVRKTTYPIRVLLI